VAGTQCQRIPDEFTPVQRRCNRGVTLGRQPGVVAIVGEPASPETVPPDPARSSPRLGRDRDAGTPAGEDVRTDTSTASVDNESPALAAAWHPVADAAELGDQPLGVLLLGQAWVLVRLDGQVVAFEDRCPHRLAPLSAGWVDGDQLRCRYHGWSFGGDGRCTLIPANGPDAAIPPRACLRQPAGVAERYGLVWLAPKPPVCDIHPFPEWDDPAFDRSWTPPRRTPAGATQLADNFLDAAHFPTVHTTTFGTPEAAYVSPHTVDRDGWEVRTVYEAPYRNHDDPLVPSGEHPLVQPHVLTKLGRPAAAVRLTLDFPLTGDRLAVLFACQPETRGSSRVYKLMARSGYDGDPDRLAELVRYETVVLQEDLAILERYRDHSLSVDLSSEVHTRADRLSVAYRRLLRDLVDRGVGGDGAQRSDM
jgi:phenylpropionate dioxygenase-like ring-hydroxylating dioxygenase large terminal subunit